MSMIEAVEHVFSHYADFSGRARRSEYWYFALFNALISAFGSAFETARLNGNNSFFVTAVIGLVAVYNLAAFIPRLAVTWRRFHDVGRSGACIFLVWVPMAAVIALSVLLLITTRGGEATGALIVLLLIAASIATTVLSIVLLVWRCRDGDHFTNQYGPDPKAPAEADDGEKAPWEY